MQDKQFGDYRVLDYIGSGAMAKVYLAVHKDVPNLKVVLKVLSDSRLAERFKQEADKLALLDKNPNICKIRHFFNHGDEFVIAMEYIEGPSLEEILKEKTSLPIGEALKMVADIISALEPAHSQGIYHRDIKPSNIMFAKNGQVKIIDFGIAKGKTDPKLTILGTAAGTPEYMAPEQFEGGEDLDYSKCDIYAVGTMLYRMVTGDLPYKGDNEFILRDSKLFTTHVAPSKLNKEINRDLDKIITRSIQCNAEKRFDSIAEMKAQLEMVYAHYSDAPAKPKTARIKKPARIRKSGKRSKLKPLLAGIVVIIAAVFVVLKFTPVGNNFGLIFPAGKQDGENDSGQENIPAGDLDLNAKEEPAEIEKPIEKTATAPPPSTKPAAEPVAGTGELKILSRPGYSDIYIDGVLQKEQTPHTFSLSPGRHVIKIVKVIDGIKHEYTETVIITRDKTKKVNKRWPEEQN